MCALDFVMLMIYLLHAERFRKKTRVIQTTHREMDGGGISRNLKHSGLLGGTVYNVDVN